MSVRKVASVLLVFLCLLSPAWSARRPNVVLILADDLGYGDLACFGARDLETPHLDGLAASGMRLTSFYVAQAVCTASRAALLTGCYANRVGMSGALNHTSTTGVHPREKLLGELLQGAGYATAAFGKWHLGLQPMFWPTRRGFGEFAGLPYSNDNGPLHPVTRGIPALPWYEKDEVTELDPDQSDFTRRITDRSVRFIEQNKEKPFFLYVPHVMPHVPIAVSKDWKGKSRRGVYGDVVQELDGSVGEILEALRRTGVEEDTIVIFTSDNGPFLSYGEHAGSPGPHREGKLTAFEGGVRMPCIVRWPGHVPAGTVSDEVVTAMDLFSTLLGFCGAPAPEQKVDGLDLAPVFLGKPGAKGRDVFFYYSGEELHAVRQGDWKLHVPHSYLTVAAEPGRGGKPSNWGKIEPRAIEESGIQGIASRHGYRVAELPLALYNLREDPGEASNVAHLHPEVVERLRLLCAQARVELGDKITDQKGSGIRPCGDARPRLQDGVRRISNLEYSRPPRGALLLDLYLPEGAGDSAVPVVLWVHGGGWSRGAKEDCPLTWLPAQGVAVASINYRLTSLAQWPAQIEDCWAAIRWIREHAREYRLDPDRVFAAGSSAGGHLAALLGTTNDRRREQVRGVIDLFGPADLLTMPLNLPGPDRTREDLAKTNGTRLLGGIVSEREELARQASPIHQVTSDDAPFLILHGDQDPLVPFQQSERLEQALRKAGVESKLRLLPGAGHGGAAFDSAATRQEILSFLRRRNSQ
jgi:arylsulfatase